MSGLPAPTIATDFVQQVMTAGGLNAFGQALSFFANPPHFKGLLGTGVATAVATNLALSSTEDNYSGWDATNHWWVVPAGCAGLYLANFQVKWGTTQPVANIVLAILGGASGTTVLAHSPAPAALANNSGLSLSHWIRVAAGDKIGFQTANGGFTSSADTVDSTFADLGFYSV